MKNITIYIIVLFIPLLINGQALKSSYFLDNSTTRHTLNPALTPVQGYVGFPGLSSVGASVEGSLGVSSLLFPLDAGGLGTFLHPDITSEQFLGVLPDMSSLDVNLNYDIFSMGWNTGKSSFWVVDFGVRFNVHSAIPKDFFSLLKNGMYRESTSYSIKNFSFAQDAYAQVGIGYSQDIRAVKGLRMGWKLKVLVGMDNAMVSINSLDIDMAYDKWAISTDANAHIMGKGIGFQKDEDGKITSLAVDPGNLGVAGFGAAFDFGVEYKFSDGTGLDGLAISASATDLGFISYSSYHVQLAETTGQSFDFVGFDGFDILDLNISEELDAIQQEIFALASLREVEPNSRVFKGLSAKLHLGLEYSFMKGMMSFGLLYSGVFGPLLNQNELTISYNLTPNDWFGLVLSYSVLNTRQSLGWLLNFTPRRGVNFFVGSDYTMLSFTPQGIPLGAQTFLNAQLGISFPIGANNIRGKTFVQRPK